VLEQLAQLTVNGLITGTILALTAVGATLVFGIQRIANLAHGEFLTFAAYVALLLNVFYGLNLFIAAAGAMVGTAVLAVLLHVIVLKPLSNRGLVATCLITVGLGLMLRDVIFLVAGPRCGSSISTRPSFTISAWCGSRRARPWRWRSRWWWRRWSRSSSPAPRLASRSPEIAPRRRSSGAATLAAMTSRSAPGRFADTRMVGNSMVGRLDTGKWK
jgi:hypothetical protein